MRRATRSAVVALAGVAAVLFAVEAVNEWDYASGHAYAYGPAKVIAVVCLAGCLLSIAVLILALALAGSRSQN